MSNPYATAAGHRLWTRAEIQLADRLNREGRQWMQIWREHFADRGSNNSLRQAVVAYREGGWPEQHDRARSQVRPAYSEKPMHPARVAAILSRPTARQAALLACEPQDALRLVEWRSPSKSPGVSPWTR